MTPPGDPPLEEPAPPRWGDTGITGALIVVLPLLWCAWGDDPQTVAEFDADPPYAGTPLQWVLSWGWICQFLWSVPAGLWLVASGRRRAFRGLVIAMFAVAAFNFIIDAFGWSTALYFYLL